MAEREWVDPETRQKYILGTAEDAGVRCPTTTERAGQAVGRPITGHQYRRLVRSGGKNYEPAPGPVMFDGMVLSDRTTGAALYDMEAVSRWHAGRPGAGAPGHKRAGTVKDPEPEPVS